MMERSTLSSTGSIAAAFIGSLCCIGPIALAVLGLGGVGLFTALGEYRQYIMAGTVVLLGLAFYFTYRKREVICEDGTCKVESASKWNKIAVWAAAVAVVFFLIFPYLNISSGTVAEDGSASIQTAVLKVEGMTCTSCNTAVEIALRKNQGVLEARASFEEKQAVVKYDPTKVKEQDLVNSVNGLGYTAELKRISNNE
ncbi:MAG: mercuric transporter MerT family protein [Bacteroidota bacterium]